MTVKEDESRRAATTATMTDPPRRNREIHATCSNAARQRHQEYVSLELVNGGSKVNDHLFVKASVVEREGRFYIQLRDRLAQRPDYCGVRRFASREEAESCALDFADRTNELMNALYSALRPPDWQSDS
jgi:hypothetical protein